MHDGVRVVMKSCSGLLSATDAMGAVPSEDASCSMTWRLLSEYKIAFTVDMSRSETVCIDEARRFIPARSERGSC